MDRTAGFAASITIREELIQRFVRVLYNAGRISSSITFTIPTVNANLFMALPELTLTSANGGRFTIELFAWGPMTVRPPMPAGSPPEARRVKFRATVQVPPTVALSNGRLRLGLQNTAATLLSYEIDPYAGGTFSANAVAYLNSPDFVSLLTQGLQMLLGALGSSFPPLDASFLGAIATHPSARVTARTLEQAVALGIDVAVPAAAPLPGVTTQGNPSLLVDASAGNDLATWTNPRAVRIAFGDVETEIREQVAEQDATLDSFDFRVEEGWFKLSGKASATGGSVNFSVHAVPRLIRPGRREEWDEEYGEHFEYTTPDLEELWFDPQDVWVDIDRDWWVVVLEVIGGIITLGVGALAAEAIVGMIRGNIVSGIDQDGPARADRNQVFTIAGVSRPPIRLRIETFECHAEGIFAGINIRPQFWYGLLEGPRQIGAEEAFSGSVRYTVSLPPDVLPQDPELRVSWTVRRTDTNDILLTRDTQAQAGLRLDLDNGNIPFLQVSELSIQVRVYRPLGVGVTEVFFQQQYLQVSDYLDRSRPYVRWQHDAMVPVVRVEPDGTRTTLGLEVTHRRSDIHRTAIPGRCRSMRFHSRNRLIPPDSVDPYPLEYLDQLPFPEQDLVQQRAQVCDYCFFGGPDKDVPLI